MQLQAGEMFVFFDACSLLPSILAPNILKNNRSIDNDRIFEKVPKTI